MGKYICTVCGYDYDSADGDPSRGIAPGTRWEDLPEDWVCPICGADKSMFVPEGGAETAGRPSEPGRGSGANGEENDMLVNSVVCSNLARGCAKQYLEEESGLFARLADYFESRAEPRGDLESLAGMISEDAQTGYALALDAARKAGDRGAQRALTWGEKVSRIQGGLLGTASRAISAGEQVFVCGPAALSLWTAPPAICPVCRCRRLSSTRSRGHEHARCEISVCVPRTACARLPPGPLTRRTDRLVRCLDACHACVDAVPPAPFSGF